MAVLAAVVLLAGCGAGPPPDEATSRELVARTILDWHRYLATGDGEAGCRMLTEKRQDGLVKATRGIAAINGSASPDDCVEAVATYLTLSEHARQVLLDTQVDAVRVNGERATATAHTSAVINGVRRQVPSVALPLKWDDGRWLLD